jgi:hypothetical protein
MKTSFSSPERLEDRIAPAGVVTITSYDPATGQLSIAGDGGDNAVTLFQTAPGHFRLASFDPQSIGDTTGIDFGAVQGAAFIDLTGKLQAVNINLVGGSDALLLQDLPGIASLVVNMGGGDDAVVVKNVATTQQASIDLGSGDDGLELSGASVKVGGDLLIEDGGDGMTVNILSELVVKGALVIAGNSGNDEVTATSLVSALTVSKGVNFLGGSGGKDTLSLSSSTTLTLGKAGDGRSLLATASPDGMDVLLNADNATIAGALLVAGGAGDDRLAVFALTRLTIGKNSLGESIHFDGGAGGGSGMDAVAIVGTCTLAGGISLQGEGAELSLSNSLSQSSSAAPFGALSIGKLKSGESIAGSSQTADVILNLTSGTLTLGGGLSAAGATVKVGLTAATANIGRSATGHSVLLESAGEAAFGLNVLRAAFKGGVEASTGAPDGFTGAFQAVDVTLGKTNAGDSLRLASGNAGGELQMQVGTLKASGRLAYLGGSGADSVHLAATQISAPLLDIQGGGGTNELEMQVGKLKLGALSYLGGGSDDTVVIAAAGKVSGDMTIALGAALSENHLEMIPATAGAADLNVGGNFKVTSTSGAVQLDTVVLDRLTVAKTFIATLGAGPTALTIDAMTVKGLTNIDTGDGDDVVNIERGSGFRNSAFKDFTFNGGLGADTVRIGNGATALINATNRVAFSGVTKIMGGADTDTLNADFQTANIFATPPTVDSF